MLGLAIGLSPIRHESLPKPVPTLPLSTQEPISQNFNHDINIFCWVACDFRGHGVIVMYNSKAIYESHLLLFAFAFFHVKSVWKNL